MDNLLEKVQLIEYIIILILYLVTSNLQNENDCIILNTESEYYKYLKRIVSYNEIFDKYLKKVIPIDKCNYILQNNEYFYLYHNKYNIYTYFYKEKDSDIHNIYFNGINNKKDLNIIVDTVLKIIINKFNYEYIEKLMNKNGLLYKIEMTGIKKLKIIDDDKLKENTLLNTFEYIFYNVYENNNIVNININGYSLGGILSQVFVYKLLELYPDRLNIKLYNIESWFGGNETEYNEFIKNVEIENLYNTNSIFNIYNKLIQPYHNNNKYLETKHDYKYYIKNLHNNIDIVKYINKYHFLSKIIK